MEALEERSLGCKNIRIHRGVPLLIIITNESGRWWDMLVWIKVLNGWTEFMFCCGRRAAFEVDVVQFHWWHIHWCHVIHSTELKGNSLNEFSGSMMFSHSVWMNMFCCSSSSLLLTLGFSTLTRIKFLGKLLDWTLVLRNEWVQSFTIPQLLLTLQNISVVCWPEGAQKNTKYIIPVVVSLSSWIFNKKPWEVSVSQIHTTHLF